MTFKPGDKVRVIDGYGEIITAEATVLRYHGRGIVVVCDTVNGQEIVYGVPISAVEPATLRRCKYGE